MALRFCGVQLRSLATSARLAKLSRDQSRIQDSARSIARLPSLLTSQQCHGIRGFTFIKKESSKSTQIQAAERNMDSIQGTIEGWRNTLVLGVLFAGWYGANVFFNIFNKQVLKAYPCPLTSTCLQFGIGSIIVVLGWAFKLLKVPQIDKQACLTILPLAVVHTLGNTFTNLSLGQVAVSFTHTIKALEPFFSVALSAMFLGEKPTVLVMLSLFPIVGGVAMASFSEASFNWTGFLTAMGSNLSFQSRNVLSKKTMHNSKLKLDNISLFSLITIASFILLLPFACMLEGDLYSINVMRSMGILEPAALIKKAVWAGVFFHLYQQVSYMILERVSPVTHSVGNCVKRVIIIVASVIFFQNPMSSQNIMGTSLALTGVFLYSQAKRLARTKSSSMHHD
eukprot:g944.t1